MLPCPWAPAFRRPQRPRGSRSRRNPSRGAAMAHHGKNMIGGELSAAGSQKFRALNPATGAMLDGEFVEATPAELDKALDLAARAFPVYRKVAHEQIAGFLERIGAEIVALGAALIDRTSAETGLPTARLEGER